MSYHNGRRNAYIYFYYLIFLTFILPQAYDIDTLELIENFTGGENPICTLAAGQNMLFSGSLKSIKVIIQGCLRP